MAGWTKQQYDGAYSFLVQRRMGGRLATEPPIVTHYHKWAMRPYWLTAYSVLQPILQIPSSANVCVVGAGFGWGVEGIIQETGANVVGIDISDYVIGEQANTETAELRQLIIDAGLDPDSGRGAEILSFIDDGAPRANVVVLQEDANTNQSRNAIRQALGGNWPDVCIVEDLIDEATTDQEITAVNNALNLFAGTQRIIWICTADFPHRSFAQLQTLTGAEVINTSGTVHLVP